MKAHSLRKRALKAFQLNLSTWRLLILSAIIGVIAGMAAIAFHYVLEFAKYAFLDGFVGFRPEGPPGEHEVFLPTTTPFRPWLFLIITPLGGLLGGLLVSRFAPEAEGHGTDAAIDCYHHKAGKIRARVPFVKLAASALTIGTGGSAGREGPIAQIGAGIASLIASYLKIPVRERRILVAAGMAAGVGAIFRAPLAGALFAAEVLYRDLDLEYEVIIPSVISSIIGYATYSAVFGWAPLFQTPDFVHQNPLELLPYLVLAIVVAIGATAFTRCFYFVRDSFKVLPVPDFLKPAIGGLLVGIIGFFCHDALGAGYGIVQKAFDAEAHHLGIGVLVLIAVAKIFTTSFSIGSGGSGGVFGPSIVIGGALGGAVGLWMQDVCANFGMDLEPGAFVVVGMAGFFAAAANTPISTIIMVSEMTGNYHLLVPSMWVCVIAYLMMRRYALYENQIENRFDAPVHRGDMMDAILKNVTVRDLLAKPDGFHGKTFPSSASVHDLLECFSTSDQAILPIVDDKHLVGMISGRELRYMMMQDKLDMLLIAEEVAHPAITVCPNNSLLDAVRIMSSNHLDEILVVAPDESDKLLGTVSQRDIVLAYDRQLATIVRKDSAEAVAADTPHDDAFDVRDLMSVDHMVLTLTPGDKASIVRQLAQPLLEGGHTRDIEGLIDTVMERESKMTTAIAPGVALPHAQHLDTIGLDTAHIVVGLCREGTEFEAIDENPTQLFFLICSVEQTVHLKIMSQLARLIRSPDAVRALCAVDSAENMLATLQGKGQNTASS
ncbi:MAG: CIC family chloride channel protein [Kiritimatiellia bacterium]|jgi:chloride channel protein, CIC family